MGGPPNTVVINVNQVTNQLWCFKPSQPAQLYHGDNVNQTNPGKCTCICTKAHTKQGWGGVGWVAVHRCYFEAQVKFKTTHNLKMKYSSVAVSS